MDKGDVLTLTQLLVAALLPTQFEVIVIDPASIYFVLHCVKMNLGSVCPVERLLQAERHRMFIVLSVCLMSSPQTCREEHLRWSLEASNSMACVLSAQEVIAKWHESHTEWVIQRWRCAAKGALLTDI